MALAGRWIFSGMDTNTKSAAWSLGLTFLFGFRASAGHPECDLAARLDRQPETSSGKTDSHNAG